MEQVILHGVYNGVAVAIQVTEDGKLVVSGGGSGGAFNGNVDQFSDLPNPTTVSEQYYFVQSYQGSGTSYKPAGVYYSNGTTWLYDTSFQEQLTQIQNAQAITATATGTNTYAATTSPAITSYVTGQEFTILFTNGNTGNSTINFNGLGPKTLVKNTNVPLGIGDILAGQYLKIKYDGTNFQLLNTNYVNNVDLPILGTIINQPFTSSTTGWTNVGSGSFSIVSNRLQCSGGNNTNNNYFRFDTYGNSNLESYTATYTIIAGTINSTSFGVGLAIVSQASFQQWNAFIKFALDSANLGKITITLQGTTTITKTSRAGMTISAGDVLTANVTFIKSKFQISLYNNNTGFSTFLDFDLFSTSPLYTVMPNAFRFGIGVYGGTHSVSNFNVVAKDNVGVDWLVVGDSISKGFSIDNISNRFTEYINQVTALNTLTNAGASNKIEDINANEVLSLAPKNIIILLGTNNIATGDTAAVAFGKLQTLIASLTSYTVGTNLFIGYLLPRGLTDINVFNASVFSTYGLNGSIDFNTEFNNSNSFNTAYTIDNVHPNNTGHQIMGEIIINKFNLTLKTKKVSSYSTPYYGANNFVSIASSKFKGATPNHQLDIINENGRQLRVGIDTNLGGGTLFTTVPDGVFLAGGCYYDNAYIASSNSATMVALFQGSFFFYHNTGLTPGNSFGPNLVATFNATNGWTYINGQNMAFGTGAGTRIGTNTSQRFAFWNASPIPQPNTSSPAATFAANTSGILNDTATYDGYTIGQAIRILRNLGLLA